MFLYRSRFGGAVRPCSFTEAASEGRYAHVPLPKPLRRGGTPMFLYRSRFGGAVRPCSFTEAASEGRNAQVPLPKPASEGRYAHVPLPKQLRRGGTRNFYFTLKHDTMSAPSTISKQSFIVMIGQKPLERVAETAFSEKSTIKPSPTPQTPIIYCTKYFCFCKCLYII